MGPTIDRTHVVDNSKLMRSLLRRVGILEVHFEPLHRLQARVFLWLVVCQAESYSGAPVLDVLGQNATRILLKGCVFLLEDVEQGCVVHSTSLVVGLNRAVIRVGVHQIIFLCQRPDGVLWPAIAGNALDPVGAELDCVGLRGVGLLTEGRVCYTAADVALVLKNEEVMNRGVAESLRCCDAGCARAAGREVRSARSSTQHRLWGDETVGIGKYTQDSDFRILAPCFCRSRLVQWRRKSCGVVEG